MENKVEQSNNLILTREARKSKADINFKKWLLSLSSIGNLILGVLLIIMGIQYLNVNDI